MSRVASATTVLLALLLVVSGCATHWRFLGRSDPVVPIQNPVIIPVSDREFVWDQVVDTLDDYFRISAEDRVRVVGGILTEGHIETFPVVGATLFEPWRRDSTPGAERLHSTLQSIRRRAQVRVMPVTNGYSIEVAVFKELEDVSRPEYSTVSGPTMRHDGAFVRVETGPESLPITLGWIPLGRDVSLEQQILAEIQARTGLRF